MLSIVLMNKRSILTAVLALGLGVAALTGCSNTGANYVTPSDVKTVETTIAEVGDQGVKNVITLHPLHVTAEDAKPVTVTITDKDGITTDFKVTVTEGAN